MKVVAIANQKGGVGKTTITRELSACCALRGYSVLAIDCDPQGSLSNTWIPDLDENTAITLANVVVTLTDGLAELEDTIINLATPGLDLVPANIKLSRFDQEKSVASLRLKQQIDVYCQEYDFVFIDCPPQLGNLLMSALYAASHILIPCNADIVGLAGLSDLDLTIREVMKLANPKLIRLGAIINMYKPTRSLSASSRAAVEQAAALVGDIFETNVHDYAKIAEAPSQKVPVVEYAQTHRAADIFWSLTDEFLDRIKMSRSKISAVK